MFLEKRSGRLAPLADAFTAVRIPSAALLDDSELAAEIDDFSITRNTGAVEKIEFGFFERWRHFILDYFDTDPSADHVVAVFERADAPNIHAHRGVELERVAAGRGFRGCRTSRRSSCESD